MKKKGIDEIKKEREKYRELCRKESSICIFLKDYWLDAVCDNDQWSAVLYEKGGNIFGALVFNYIVKGNRIAISQPIQTQSNGIWIKPFTGKNEYKRLEYEKEVFSGLIDKLEKLPLINYRQNFTVDITNWLPFYWKGFQQTTKYTYRIMNITDAELAIAGFSSGKRGNINQAQKAGLQIGFDLSAKEFYENHVLSLNHQGKTISYSYDVFEKIVNTVYEHKCGRTIYAWDEEKNIHAALLIVWDANCAFYLINSVDPRFRNSGAAALLVAEMIRYVSRKGIKQFDFEGSMIEGVEKSYRQFGTKQIPYFEIRKDYYKNSLDYVFVKAQSLLVKCLRKGKNIIAKRF